MAVAARLHRDAQHFGAATDGQRPHGNVSQSARDDVSGVDRRIAKLRQQRQAADMVLVAVAQHQRVDVADVVDVRQQTRRRSFAEVEHEALAVHFDQETGRPLHADARNDPQCRHAIALASIHRCATEMARGAVIDKRKPPPYQPRNREMSHESP